MTKIHNFPDKIKLVINKDNMAYIALDDSSLETGMSWAKGWWHNNYIPKVYNYDNGSFIFKLHSAADNSSQNGKLSFWTLEIGCPDGQVFQVGINAESLFEALMETTCIEGSIVGKFYIGRTDGQQAFALSNGKVYKEYLDQIESKKAPLTKDYGVGDIIKNARNEYVYLGEGEEILSYDFSSRGFNGKYALAINTKNPKPLYYYIHTHLNGLTVRSFNSKMNGRIIGHEDVTIETYKSENVFHLIYDKINLYKIKDRSQIDEMIKKDFIITKGE